MCKLKSFDILCVYVFLCACKPRFYMHTFRRKNENTYMSEFVNLNFFILTPHAHLQRRVQVEVPNLAKHNLIVCISLFPTLSRRIHSRKTIMLWVHTTQESDTNTYIHSVYVYIWTYSWSGPKIVGVIWSPTRARIVYIVDAQCTRHFSRGVNIYVYKNLVYGAYILGWYL